MRILRGRPLSIYPQLKHPAFACSNCQLLHLSNFQTSSRFKRSNPNTFQAFTLTSFQTLEARLLLTVSNLQMFNRPFLIVSKLHAPIFQTFKCSHLTLSNFRSLRNWLAASLRAHIPKAQEHPCPHAPTNSLCPGLRNSKLASPDRCQYHPVHKATYLAHRT